MKKLILIISCIVLISTLASCTKYCRCKVVDKENGIVVYEETETFEKDDNIRRCSDENYKETYDNYTIEYTCKSAV